MFISSDTNIWIDFQEANHLDHPFRLDYQFFLSKNAYEEELLKSEQLRRDLLSNGLQLAEVTEDEFARAMAYEGTYRALSFNDRIALSIAKTRGWILLTGDKPLRNAAEAESVECHGTIWIYDELKVSGKMSEEEFHSAIDDLIKAVENAKCRLPMDELRKRQGNGK